MPRLLLRAPTHDRNFSLGWLATAWMEFFCLHGDGDVLGEPVLHGDEYTGFIVDSYALHPPGTTTKAKVGRRLYDAVFFSRPKGADKSGLGARFAMFEALGPCRFDGIAEGGEVYKDPWGLGFRYVYSKGEPMGRPIRSPFIRCMATEETQTGNVYDNIHFNLTEGHLAACMKRRDDAGLTRVNLPERGEITPSTASSASKDGGKETFVDFDEALAIDTPLPTPTGWTDMGSVRVGDMLIGSDGQPTRVVKTTEVMVGRDSYEVTFHDGSSVLASAGHLWQTRVTGSAAKPRVRTTEQMFKDGRKFSLPANRGLDTPDIDLPIDPYVLGLWLGDGDKNNATVSTSTDDIDATMSNVTARGYTCRPNKARTLFYVSRPGSHRNRFSPVKGFLVELREAGLLGNKHIPSVYLRAGTEQRRELLRGLMDSDGSISPGGHATFTNDAPELLNGITELLHSLGQKAGRGWQNDSRSKMGRVGRVWFTSRFGLQPFAMPRKANLVNLRNVDLWDSVTSIEKVTSVPVKCVGVAADDHLFVAGTNWVVTHNTHLYDTPELRRMYATVTRNLRKRKKIAETWFLETTTMFAEGDQSIAEKTYDLAQQMMDGKTVRKDGLLLDHQWGECEDVTDEKALRAAIRDAYGDAMAWMDEDGLVDEFYDPRNEEEDSRRYFLNAKTSHTHAYVRAENWDAVRLPLNSAARNVAPKEVITLGFDGSRKRTRGVTDATALIGCRVSDGYLFTIQVWEQPPNWRKKDGDGKPVPWEVPHAAVDRKVHETFEKYTVVGFYADPAKWETYVANWEAKYRRRLKIKATAKNPIEWWMVGGNAKKVYEALESFYDGIIEKQLCHGSAPTQALTRHMLNARRLFSKSGYGIHKEHPSSPKKIDAAVAAVLAYQARLDALAQGVNAPKRKQQIPQRIR